MLIKKYFKNNVKYPVDAVALSFLNLFLALISFKNLTDFFTVSSFESWALLFLIVLGLGVSISIFKFKAWSFQLFHLFAAFVSLTALTQLYFQPEATSYYTLLAVITYSGVGSLVLHRYAYSACFRNYCTEKSRRLSMILGARLSNDQHDIPVNLFDISKSGCFLSTKYHLELGQEFQLQIEIDGFEFNSRCKVVRESDSPIGYGLMFTGVDHRRFPNLDVAISGLYKKVNSRAYPASQRPVPA